MRIYLAGPMTGIPKFNFPKFLAAACALREMGHEVFCPAENDIATYGEEPFMSSALGRHDDIEHLGCTYRAVMKTDLSWICDYAEGIAMLPGWENSKGANAEWALAKCLGLEIIYLADKSPDEIV